MSAILLKLKLSRIVRKKDAQGTVITDNEWSKASLP
jgi:hypothetical protein